MQDIAICIIVKSPKGCGKMVREGWKYSQHYWYNSNVFCRKCGLAYGISGNNHKEKRLLRCVDRAKYGADLRVDKNGAEVGCNSNAITRASLSFV